MSSRSRSTRLISTSGGATASVPRRPPASTCAIHESLKRRLQKRQELHEELEALPPTARARPVAALQGRLIDAELEDDLDDEARTQLGDPYRAALACSPTAGPCAVPVALLRDHHPRQGLP